MSINNWAALFSLGTGDFRFAWIAVLGDEVAREAGQVVISNFPGTPGAKIDHFAGARKMVVRIVT